MVVDLNDSNTFTIESVADLIASGDDSTHTQIRVTTAGVAFLSKDVGATKLGGIAFRLETFSAGNGYVGQQAVMDAKWVARVFEALKKNWPNPSSSYIDFF